MNFMDPKEHSVDRDTNPFSSEKEHFYSLFNHDDDFIGNLFSDFKKENPPIATDQIPETKKELLPNGNSLNFIQQAGSSNEVTHHETGLPKIQKEPINDKSELEFLRMKCKKIANENSELKSNLAHTMELDDLQMRFDNSEKQNLDLKDKIYELEAQNYQYRQLVKQKDEEELKMMQRLKELSNKIEEHQKWKNILDTRATHLAKTENSLKKRARENKKIFKVIDEFAEKLSSAGLLTVKDKKVLRNLALNSSNPEEEYSSEDQEKETDHSPPSKSCKEEKSNISQNVKTTPEHSYCAPVPRRSLVFKSPENIEKGFQFKGNKTSSFQRPKQSSGVNYFMKGCQDAIDDLNVSDYVNETVNQLEEIRCQFSTVNRQISPISPIPPTPPPKNTTSRYNMSSKDLTTINPCIVIASPNQNSQISNNRISQETKSPYSTPRKNQFCHQQSEGFEVPTEQPHNTSNLNSEDSENSVQKDASSTSLNYINLNAERVGGNGMNFKFDVPCAAQFKIDLDNWNVSCFLKGKQKSSTMQEKSSSLPSEIDLINEQKVNTNSQPNNEGFYKRNSKIVIESPSSKDLASVERSNQVSTVNHNISRITNTDYEHAFRKKSINFSQSSVNSCHDLETDVRSQNESFEDQVENCRSSSSETPSPLKKKLKISASPQLCKKSILGNEERLSSYTFETAETNNVLIDQAEIQLKCNSEQKSSDSQCAPNVINPDITSSLESRKFNTRNSGLRRKRRNNQISSNEKLSIIPLHSTKKICKSKTVASISNLKDNYVTEFETKNNCANANNEIISEIDGDEGYLKRSITETTVNKQYSLQNFKEISTLNAKSEESENVEHNLTNKTYTGELGANIHNYELPDEDLFQETEQNKEYELPFEKSKTKAKNKSLKKIKKKQSRCKTKEKNSLKRQASEFVNVNVSVKDEQDEVISLEKPNSASFSVSTSISDNLEHAHEEVSVIGAPKIEVFDQNIPINGLLPNIEIENPNNCSSINVVNTASKISSSKTEYETFLQDSYMNNFIKNELDVNEKESQGAPSMCEELFVNEQVLDSNEFDSSAFLLPYDKIIKQEIDANEEYNAAKTSEIISQNTVFPKENSSWLDKSNLRDNQLSITETNEFTRYESNNSPIKIKCSPLSSPEAGNVDVMNIDPFNPDPFTGARNVYGNEEFFNNKNIPNSENSDKEMNFSIFENDKLNKMTSLEEEINEDQNNENIRMDSFNLFNPDGIPTNPILISPIKEKNQYSISEKFLTSEMKEELSNSKRQQEDNPIEIGREKSLSPFIKSAFVNEEINAIENSELIPKVSQNIEKEKDNAAISDLKDKAGVEMKTQGTFFRSSKKGQNLDLRETELEKSFIGEQSASVNSDPKHITDQISEMDSDYEPTLVIAEDVEVSHPSNDSESEDSEKIAEDSASKNNLVVALSEMENENSMYSKENYDIIELPEIVKSTFQAVEKMKFCDFRACVRSLISVLIDPTNVPNCQFLIYYLVKHLHVSKKNPMQSFNHGNNSDVLFPLTENCFVTALFLIIHKNAPHLSGLLISTIDTFYQLILLKTQYHIYGLSSLCRVLTVICKQLKDSKKIKHLCYDLLRHNHKFAPFLIATIVGVWPEALTVSSNSTEEERFFIRAITCGCERKPKTLTYTQWKNCENVLSKFLIVEELQFSTNEIVNHLMDKVLNKFLCDDIDEEVDFMLKGSLVIYSRIKGWNWTRKHMLEKFIIPKIESFKDNEKAFIYLTSFFVDLCFAFDAKYPATFLSGFVKSPSEAEFVKCYGGLALSKLICLRKHYFPPEMERWIRIYADDSRANSCFNHFLWRMKKNHGLTLKDICQDNAIIYSL